MSQTPQIARNSTAMDRYTRAWTTTNLLIRQGRSFSGNERHACFLNTHDGLFADASAVSGLNLPEDGRGIAMTDWDGDGDLDLWITHRTAPRVRFFRNATAGSNHFLQVKLQGTTCNRDCIGARLELVVPRAGRQDPAARYIKTVRAGEGFLGQSSKLVHFGLGDHTQIEKLVVHWPGGSSDEYRDLKVDGRYRIVQGASPRLIESDRAVDLPPRQLNSPASSETGRIRLVAPVPLPHGEIEHVDGRRQPLRLDSSQQPLLLTLWASWCQPCLQELQAMAEAAPQLDQHHLQIIALNVDRLDADQSAADPASILEKMSFPYMSAYATESLVRALDVVQRTILDRKRSLPIPCSFLIDSEGRLAVIYKGTTDVAQIISDLATLSWHPDKVRESAIPFPGRWSTPAEATDPMRIAVALYNAGLVNAATDYTWRIERFVTGDVGSQYMSPSTRTQQRTDAHAFRGVVLLEEGRLSDAAKALKRAVQLTPDDLRSRMKLGEAYGRMGDADKAVEHLSAAVAIAPEDPDLQYDLAVALTQTGSYSQAVDRFRAALQLRPGWPPAANNLAWILATHPDGQVRDGAAAVRLAREVCQRVDFRDPAALDTLAAALAETGRFELASRVARRAQKIAERQGKRDLGKSLVKRLERYGRRRPFRDDSMREGNRRTNE